MQRGKCKENGEWNRLKGKNWYSKKEKRKRREKG